MRGNRLYRQVVRRILDLIESGEYPVGSRLPPERELAERFKVSRPTVREAVIALEATGNIGVKSGSGMFVTSSHSPPELVNNISPFELMEARFLIEGEVGALAASLITSEQLEALEEALELMEYENENGDFGSDTADRRFHTIIAEATNNNMLKKFLEILWNTLEGQDHIKQAQQAICKADPALRLEEHRVIFDALKNRDPQAARISMQRHFIRLFDALHDKTEEAAVAEVQEKLSYTRARFSTERIRKPV